MVEASFHTESFKIPHRYFVNTHSNGFVEELLWFCDNVTIEWKLLFTSVSCVTTYQHRVLKNKTTKEPTTYDSFWLAARHVFHQWASLYVSHTSHNININISMMLRLLVLLANHFQAFQLFPQFLSILFLLLLSGEDKVWYACEPRERIYCQSDIE